MGLREEDVIGQVPLNTKSSLCIKTADWQVLYQSLSCKGICGDQSSIACKKTCFEEMSAQLSSPCEGLGIHIFRHVKIDSKDVDLVIHRTANEIVSIISPNDQRRAKEIDYYESLGLTKRELQIVKLALNGESNAKISEMLEISKSTLKTHINNIYRKAGDTSALKTRLRY